MKRKLESDDASPSHSFASSREARHAPSHAHTPPASSPELLPDAADASQLFPTFTRLKPFLSVSPKLQRAHSSPASPARDGRVPFKRAKTSPAVTPEPTDPPRPRPTKIKRSKTDRSDFDSDSSVPTKNRKKRRGKRLTDTSLPPLFGTHEYDAPVRLRCDSSTRGSSDLVVKIDTTPVGERILWNEEVREVRAGLKTSEMTVE